MIIKGKVFVLGDDIDTDIIIPTEYLAMKSIDEMKKYAFSPLRPELAGLLRPGDVIVAGRNFGCGSSREQAPEIIRSLQVGCIIAKSFARIFYRNSINNGLLLIENSIIPGLAEEGSEISVLPGEYAEYKGVKHELVPLPQNLMDIINAGGLVEAMKKKNNTR
ncbi:3-isopropylmalate dehydratase small subunit [Bacillota bacterium]